MHLAQREGRNSISSKFANGHDSHRAKQKMVYAPRTSYHKSTLALGHRKTRRKSLAVETAREVEKVKEATETAEEMAMSSTAQVHRVKEH